MDSSASSTERSGRGKLVWTALVVAVVITLALATTGLAAGAKTELVSVTRVSVSSTGRQAWGLDAVISADGRYVAFDSGASNLASRDTNRALDVFVRDRKLHTTTRVSVPSSGHQGNGDSWRPAISADGRYVAFESTASNLVSHDTNGKTDVFVRDRKLHKTRRMSVSSRGHQGNDHSDVSAEAISSDGRYVVFRSDASNLVSRDTNRAEDVFVRDRKLHKTRRVSVSSSGHQGNADSSAPAISADGRYVAFNSKASDLVSGDTAHTDVFVRDRKLGATERVSVASTGVQGNNNSYVDGAAISADGRYVTFDSNASNLVSGDTNSSTDVFVRNRELDATRRVSLSSTGDEGNMSSFDPAISAEGRYVAFNSSASNLVAGDTNEATDVFVTGPLW